MEHHQKKAVVAFSGGLDTSYCVLYLKEQGFEVHTITIDTGGFTNEELAHLEQHSKKLGATSHKTIDGKAAVYDQFISYVIKGNILRGGVYPLCVGAERILQAELAAIHAKELDAAIVCHGSTKAGNDQVRFDVALRAVYPEVKISAPIRELNLSRQQEVDYLKSKGIDFPAKKKTYSINVGILGTTIGGGETHDPWKEIPEEAYTFTTAPQHAPEKPERLIIEFTHGLPTKLNGEAMHGISLLMKLNAIGAKHGIGRGIHTGDTILGIKGRIAFEAPAASILIPCHREIEKLVLTELQAVWKQRISDEYGMLLHKGLWFDPIVRDLTAAIDSSQKNVSGEVEVELYKGNVRVVRLQSKSSLMHAKARYGESSGMWDGRDAEGFCKIYGIPSAIAQIRDHQN
ncbi:argininosuccinate synthase [Candidatus Woesearchaeota archaeon]|nr:argininosuccinate synthase [Candidatus Woesearchaeota archaeon]